MTPLENKEERASVSEAFSSQANFDAGEKKIYRLLLKSIKEYNRIFEEVDKSGNKTCSECLTEQLEITKRETGQELTIETEPLEPKELIKPCQFCSKPYSQSQLKPRHIKNLPNHDPREIILICQECLTYRATKADYYCPLTSKGRDTYEGNEYDCYCQA
ncbi:14271_t:CDS:2 [Ambispora leptoticha]|uniref:14271_t:CDS:1 n=1 Tax=Ambispora leptoticha TaxID=144679 RepID=A0A9N9GW37_9GLOM|nr:14271_t:CDS:2 [Ambispora leptoticha]